VGARAAVYEYALSQVAWWAGLRREGEGAVRNRYDEVTSPNLVEFEEDRPAAASRGGSTWFGPLRTVVIGGSGPPNHTVLARHI
jgi:hypothetical protein